MQKSLEKSKIVLEEKRKTVKQKICIKRHTFTITSHSRANKNNPKKIMIKTLKQKTNSTRKIPKGNCSSSNALFIIPLKKQNEFHVVKLPAFCSIYCSSVTKTTTLILLLIHNKMLNRNVNRSINVAGILPENGRDRRLWPFMEVKELKNTT